MLYSDDINIFPDAVRRTGSNSAIPQKLSHMY